VRRGLRPSLRCALVLVATVAAAATREVALQRRGNATAMCDGDKARMCAANNAGAGTTAEQFARTWAAPWGQMRAWALLGPLQCLVGGVRRRSAHFVNCSHGFFFMERPSYALMGAFLLAQPVASIIAGFADWGFTYIQKTSAAWIGIVWVWVSLLFVYASCVANGVQSESTRFTRTIP